MIYNYQDLVPLLRARGHVFRTNCDTETIIHAWEEWGADCLQHLNGMFVFALWDRRRGTLFMARDRLGKKPLHYARLADGSLYFASELASFAEVPGLSRRVSATAVDDFFAYGYIPDPRHDLRGHRQAARRPFHADRRAIHAGRRRAATGRCRPRSRRWIRRRPRGR